MHWYSLLRFPVFLAALSLMGICAPASAFVPPPVNIAPPFAMGKMQRDLLDRRNNQRRTQDQLTAPDAIIDTSRFDFSFTPNRARTQRNLRNFVERTRDPSARSEMQRLIETQPNIIEEIGAMLSPIGIDPHDVADAYTVWAINNWLVAEQRDEDPDQVTVNAVRQQVRGAIAATPDFASTNSTQRQEYAEALLLQAIIMADAFTAAQNSPAQLDQLSAAARTTLRGNGLDPALMNLTRDGFVPRQGADASSADGDEQTAQLAVSSDDDAQESSGFGLMFALGAGLGIALLGGVVAMRRG